MSRRKCECGCEDENPTWTPPALTRLAERQFVRINDPRGVPAYHPTEYQPARCGGTANRMSFRCEWQALHGPLCSHQCDDCKDEDTPPRGVPAYHPTEAQPARLGQGENP